MQKCSRENAHNRSSIDKKTLLEWFNKKNKSQYLEIDLLTKN